MATIIERAFELASSGECLSILELDARLRKEGYSSVTEHLRGPALRKQIYRAIADAKRERMQSASRPGPAASNDG